MISVRLLFLSLFVCLAAPTGASAQTIPAGEENESQERAALLRELAAIRGEMEKLRMEVADLREKVTDIHRVAVRPSAPPAPESVELDESRTLGSADATVAIVEFSDYQCPYCERFFSQTFPRLEESYIDTGKVRFYFRDFPLTQIHPQAKSAAIAANCAGRQDAYWEMHHGLFTNQAELGTDLYQQLARELDLDLAAFEACLAEPAQAQSVDEDLAYGQSLTVQGTPHYFIGRVEGGQLVNVLRVNGAQPYELFSKVIESLLQ